jgi:hypothetical protein
MEIDNGQSQKWRQDTATQIREICNQIAIAKKTKDYYRKKMNHRKCATHKDRKKNNTIQVQYTEKV